MSANSTSPATLFGGTWTQLKDQFLLCAGSTYSAGSTGGSANTTLSTANMPAHTHTRGTMEITGQFKTGWGDSSGGGIIIHSDTQSGAFSVFHSGDAFYNIDGQRISTSSNHNNFVKFTGSKGWTGATSSVGSGTAFSNMPPYLAVYVWKRTA